MLVSKYTEMLQGKSVIRELSEFATKRGLEIGYENVFDYSLGNPSVKPPKEYTLALKEVIEEVDETQLHGYSPSLGNTFVREEVAKSLSKRYDLPYQINDIFMTNGAASSIAHAIRAVVEVGEEVITFAPHFPEYMPYVNLTGAVLKVVPPSTKDFQIDFEEFIKLINEKTSAILINTPNNPTGVVYTEDTIKRLVQIIRDKSKEYGKDIFVISDEPYREIVFDKIVQPVISHYYEHTIMCYSFSKSLSLPGERIGYVAVNPNSKYSHTIIQVCGQISRGIGHNTPSSLIQLSVAKCLELTSDISVYEDNMNLIYDCLVELGFEVVRPNGTFYIFPKALEVDAKVFCQKALKYDLVLVPGDSFACPGYFRMAYCVETKKVRKSLEALRKFVASEYR